MSLSVTNLGDDELIALVRHNLREAVRFSQVDDATLSTMSGLSEMQVAKVVRGADPVSAVELLRLSSALDVDFDELLRPTTEMLNRRTPFIIRKDAGSISRLAGFVSSDPMTRGV